jgi:hypothetical protein
MNNEPEVSAALEDPELVALLKEHFAPDGAAEREHNAASGSLGFASIHYALVTNFRPQRVLVIGSRHGYIPAVIALALKFNGAGLLDFVDANYSDTVHGFATAYGGVGHWQDDAGDQFAPLGLGERIRVHVMRSAEFFDQCDITFDYVYLDGDHSYSGCKYDFEQALARAENGALIVMHDVAVTAPDFGVKQVFEELADEVYGKVLVPSWPGLGLVQVKKVAG